MTADLAPLPGVAYPIGTLSVADIYPTHAAVGAVPTQDRSLPGFVEQQAAQAAASVTRTGIEGDLMGQPAGWLFLAILALVILAWWR